MKKVLLFVAIATPLVFACHKEQTSETKEQNQNTPAFSLMASIESFTSPTKAVIEDVDEAHSQLKWAKDDQIGVYVPGWGENQPFTLVGNGDVSEGSFTWDNQTDQNSFPNTASVAFFPWQGTGGDNNNVYDGTMYFKLREIYSNYSSGQMLTPLVAAVSYENGSYNPIEFKHAGAAVRVTINNLPAGAKGLKMSLPSTDEQYLWGTYSISPASAGSADLTIASSEDKGKDVTLSFEPLTAPMSDPFEFVFPVPALTSPKFTFGLINNNDLVIWSRSASLPTTHPNLAHSDLMEFEPITLSLAEEKIASTIIKKNDFYLIGNNVGSHTGEGDAGNYSGDDYKFTNGKCIVDFAANGYAYIKVNGHNYWTSGYQQANYRYVEISAAIDNSHHGYVIIHNNLDGNNHWRTQDIDLGTNVNGNDYFITITDGGANIGYTVSTAKPEGYSFGTHPGTTRFWITNSTGVLNDDDIHIHFWDKTGSVDYTTWPGPVPSSSTIHPTSVTLYEGDIANKDKLYIPKGNKEFTLSYNSDGTLTLSYENALTVPEVEDVTESSVVNPW